MGIISAKGGRRLEQRSFEAFCKPIRDQQGNSGGALVSTAAN